MRFLDEQARRSQLRDVMLGVNAEMPTPEVVATASELAPHSAKLLVKAASEPCLPLLAMYEALGLHPAEGKAALEDLIARGLVRVHRLVRKGRGGSPQVLQLLDEGEAEVRKRGIEPVARVLKGGFKHDCYGRLLGQWSRRHGFRYWFERTLMNKTLDVVYEDARGGLHGVEICLSGSAKWTAEQLLKAAAIPGLVEVVAAFERKKFLHDVLREVERLSIEAKTANAGMTGVRPEGGAGGARAGNKIVGMLLSEFM